jgi:hypothetical protein
MTDKTRHCHPFTFLQVILSENLHPLGTGVRSLKSKLGVHLQKSVFDRIILRTVTACVASVAKPYPQAVFLGQFAVCHSRKDVVLFKVNNPCAQITHPVRLQNALHASL